MGPHSARCAAGCSADSPSGARGVWEADQMYWVVWGFLPQKLVLPLLGYRKATKCIPG